MVRLFSGFLLSFCLSAQLSTKLFDSLSYRFIGPAGMGGRVTDVESIPGQPHIAYVATGGGGLWKTVNHGVTWTPIFERQNTFSIGDIAIDPQNPEVIWVGTGEANPRNSVSFGDGVYRSGDGGKTWQHMGLEGTERIARVLVDPRNSNVVYVGALGHAFGPHADRGVFVTRDGGKTWAKTLYVDPSHGVSDMDIDVSNPNILYAAMWKFERKPWTFTSGSEQGGIFRSTDAGQTWKKVEKGLPKLMGRAGVKIAPSRPGTVYVIAETKDGSLFRSNDGGDSFAKVTDNADIVYRGFYFTDMRVDPSNEERLYALAYTVHVSTDGGKTWKDTAAEVHPDMHALWIDPRNPDAMWLGSDGGVASSTDRGAKWRFHNNIPLGQYYQIHADNRQPFYWLTGGQQDNSTWTGPSRTREGKGIGNGDWRIITGGDGFYAVSDPDNPDMFLSESQGGRIMRTDLRTGEQKAVGPSPRAALPADAKYRFHWNTPIVASPHGKKTFYYAGNVVFQSSNFGGSWEPISPDLTTNDKTKYGPAGGPIFQESTTAENNGTVIVLSESPVKQGVLWAGTDDGNVQVTLNGGRNWTNVAKNIAGLAPASVISHVEASRYEANTAYVSVERHMFDDFQPYIYKTTDAGRTFTNIAGDLPSKAYVQVVKEDPKNPRLLYAGTELGLFVSFEGGGKWQRLEMKNMPRVAVHDLLVHPRDNDLVVATHGRGIAIFDDAAVLQQLTPEIAAKRGHLFPPRTALRMNRTNNYQMMGDDGFYGTNPPPGALFTYLLGAKPAKEKPVKLHVFDGKGAKIAEVRNPAGEAGLNRASWNLRHDAPKPRKERAEGETSEEGPRGGGGGAVPALPGRYTVKLLLGEDVVSEQAFEVQVDPAVEAKPEDLQRQFDTAMKLRTMIAGVNQALRDLDQAKTQLEASEKAASGAAKTRVEAMKKELDAAIGRFDAGGVRYRVIKAPKLSEELGPLFGAVAGGNGAPTEAQLNAVNELVAIYATESKAHNAFVTKTLAGWSEELRKLGLLGLTAVKALP
ncbi:MAG: hypothetical protein JST93_23830 [Acidobacteria bacterium]|nr:hypothetical protein [Acidobacteriota bacterium]